MDISHCTRIVFDKIHKFEPEHARKIIGYLLLQDHGELEMAKLASYPDYYIREVAFQAKRELLKLTAKPDMLPISRMVNPQQGYSHFPRTPTTPNFQVPPLYWDPQPGNINPEFMAMNYMDSVIELQKQTQLCSLENHIDAVKTGTVGVGVANDYYRDASAANLGPKAGKRFSEYPMKVCHYFNKGFCKHGNNCRFYHGEVVPENLSQMYGSDASGEDQVISPGSLAQLEKEIIELLRSRDDAISIASLPMAYYDRYKKVLQADGYLTESQRHGKSGYSLTKLLARLKNSIRLIVRPHGQHSVTLAEDAPTEMKKREFPRNISASRQIYLTFPADSTFTEDDVSNYFKIPNQQRRMFGFVTFAHSETVKTVLDKGNPHCVQGSRVLAKPYREKAKINERRQLQEQEQALENERRSLAQLQFSSKPLSSSPHFGFSLDETKVSDDHFNLQPPEESFRFPLHAKSIHRDDNFSDEERSQPPRQSIRVSNR
ncbi:hypothetical protein V8G54_034912 [Vigna mungo]|uniref:Zinc finger CCCH domain-containing protein 18 n=1 Tax=Vigna mungo TaxID=3915 RepID=A0AAQ3RDU4_VIGMU